jgi:cytoskeletal protein RodZ
MPHPTPLHAFKRRAPIVFLGALALHIGAIAFFMTQPARVVQPVQVALEPAAVAVTTNAAPVNRTTASSPKTPTLTTPDAPKPTTANPDSQPKKSSSAQNTTPSTAQSATQTNAVNQTQTAPVVAEKNSASEPQPSRECGWSIKLALTSPLPNSSDKTLVFQVIRDASNRATDPILTTQSGNTALNAWVRQQVMRNIRFTRTDKSCIGYAARVTVEIPAN